MNIDSSAAPMTISGEAIGRMISRFAALRPRNWWRTRASAIAVPIAVDDQGRQRGQLERL